MSQITLQDKLNAAHKTALDFHFENLYAPPLYSLINPTDIYKIYNYIRDTANSVKEKMAFIRATMSYYGWIYFAGGTNRVIYSHPEYPDLLLKIAIDKVGIKDNPKEFQNQHLLKPFINKMYETSSCGTVGLCERVIPITRKEEFVMIAEDVYNVIVHKFIGQFVIDDFGTDFFLNWGIRPGFGPVLLDYPYVYELDGDKLYCSAKDLYDESQICGGIIDYDNGFNYLYCDKCGRKLFAKNVKKELDTNKIVIQGRKDGLKNMKVVIIQRDQNGNVTEETSDNIQSSKSYLEALKNQREQNEIKEINEEEETSYVNPLDAIRASRGVVSAQRRFPKVDIICSDIDRNYENKVIEDINKHSIKDEFIYKQSFNTTSNTKEYVEFNYTVVEDEQETKNNEQEIVHVDISKLTDKRKFNNSKRSFINREDLEKDSKEVQHSKKPNPSYGLPNFGAKKSAPFGINTLEESEPYYYEEENIEEELNEVKEENNLETVAEYNCLRVGSKIITPNGLVPIQDLKPGDIVTTEDGYTGILDEETIYELSNDYNETEMKDVENISMSINHAQDLIEGERLLKEIRKEDKNNTDSIYGITDNNPIENVSSISDEELLGINNSSNSGYPAKKKKDKKNKFEGF